MADHTEDALIREVNDELREEQMKKLWQRYGGYVVGAALLVVAIVAGYQGWNHYTTTTRMEEGERYAEATALMAQGETDQALNALAALAQDANTGYGALARFDRAQILADDGQAEQAAALYAQIARDTSVPPEMAALADILGAMVEIDAGAYDPAAMRVRLEEAAGVERPYRYSARELMALVEAEAGNTARALEILNALADEAGAPQALAARARNLAESLGGPAQAN